MVFLGMIDLLMCVVGIGFLFGKVGLVPLAICLLLYEGGDSAPAQAQIVRPAQKRKLRARSPQAWKSGVKLPAQQLPVDKTDYSHVRPLAAQF